eukprot:gb/GECH01012108.1/.p1 GENE.gb/GECH01012108.1/~~gb/GECH01012108.1/.p1  ORF type:complete len:554 (+),score=149.59 gb/GECH01012108.1/:1-1662(+)
MLHFKYFIFYLILFLSTSIIQNSIAVDHYQCSLAQCNIPDCRCASTSIPGSLSSSQAPQFVTITFDDALTATEYPRINRVLEKLENPDGCPGRATFYISTDYTDYYLVQKLYHRRHEIAVHTMTHSTGKDTSLSVFEDEIGGARRALSLFAKVPEEKIRGFRVPFLSLNNETLTALSNLGFYFDSSLPEQASSSSLSSSVGNFIWPYFFDHSIGQPCTVAACPNDRTNMKHPGLWESPMWGIHDVETGEIIATMDPRDPRYDNYYLFKSNFDARYNGNKTPMGLFFHSAWLHFPSNVEALDKFLDYLKTFDDVWFVSSSEVIDWARNPKTHQTMKKLAQNNTCEPREASKDVLCDDSTVSRCSYENRSRNFRTCRKNCPQKYPTVGTLDYRSNSPATCGDWVLDEGQSCTENGKVIDGNNPDDSSSSLSTPTSSSSSTLPISSSSDSSMSSSSTSPSSSISSSFSSSSLQSSSEDSSSSSTSLSSSSSTSSDSSGDDASNGSSSDNSSNAGTGSSNLETSNDDKNESLSISVTYSRISYLVLVVNALFCIITV